MRQIEGAHQRLGRIQARVGEPGEQKTLWLEVLEELSSAVEELRGASEHLRQQQEELAATRQVAEAERQRYHDLFEFAPDGYLVTNPEGIISEANRAAAAMLGVDRQCLTGKPLQLFLAKADRRTFRARLTRLRTESGTAPRFEVDLQPRHGVPFPVAVTVGAVQDSGGQCTALRWSLRDVTERKRAEEAIVWLASFPALNPNPILEADADGGVHYANAAAVQVAPNLRELGLQHPWLADLSSVAAELRGGERHSLVREVQVGSIWYEQWMDYLPEVSRVRIYCLDITKRKHAQEALRESREQLKRAQAVAHTGSWRWDSQHKEFLWSDEMYRIFGLSWGAPVTYDAFLDTVHPDDRGYVDQWWTAALGGELHDIEHRIVVGDVVKWIRERAELEFDNDATLLGVFGTAQDVSERKRGEAVLRSAHGMLVRQLTEQTAEVTDASRAPQAERVRGANAEDEMRRLGRALERRAAELGALDRVGRALTTALRPQAVFDLLLREVRCLLGTEGAIVLRHDPKTNELVVVAVDGAGIERLLDARLPAATGIVGRVFDERWAVLLPDARNDPDFYRSLIGLGAVTLRSMAGVPLISRGTAIGVLGAINKTDGAFTDDDVQILAAIANGAAVAIENAQLYAVEESRRRQLEAVRTVTAEITRELDLRRVLQLITRHAGELLGSRPGGVWLWDEEERVLTPVVWLPGKDWLRGQRIRLGEGLVGEVAELRRGMIVNAYERWPKAIPAALERGTITAVIGEPLLYHDRLLGVLVVDNEGTGRDFKQEDSDALKLVASPAAIAIQNARFFQEARQASERLERLSRRMVEMQEAERRHIARELHDEVGQILTGLKFMLDASARESTEPSRDASKNAQVVVTDLLTRVRELALDLRPAMLDDFGLLPTLMWYFGRCRDHSGVHVTFQHTGLEGHRFPTAVETAAYRAAQEALTNVVRHAKVAKATVRLWAGADTLGVQVEDEGVGFDPQAVRASRATSGLAGMEERASLLGGSVTVESTPGQGTRVTAVFPLGHRA